MNAKRFFLTIILALGLLLPAVGGATEPVQRSIDEQGTIRIGNRGPAEKEKAGEAKAAPGAVAPGQVSPGEQTPPGFAPPRPRRPGAPTTEARQKIFEQTHPNRRSKRPQPEQAPAPESR